MVYKRSFPETYNLATLESPLNFPTVSGHSRAIQATGVSILTDSFQSFCSEETASKVQAQHI